jgi:hypothetical protein
MATNAHGAVSDHPADCDALISPSLFWLLLTTLAAFFVIALAVALT